MLLVWEREEKQCQFWAPFCLCCNVKPISSVAISKFMKCALLCLVMLHVLVRDEATFSALKT